MYWWLAAGLRESARMDGLEVGVYLPRPASRIRRGKCSVFTIVYTGICQANEIEHVTLSFVSRSPEMRVAWSSGCMSSWGERGFSLTNGSERQR